MAVEGCARRRHDGTDGRCADEDAQDADGQRTIYGGFSPIVEKGSAKGASYTDGFVVPVPAANRDAYIRVASNAASVFEEYGALRVVEGWGDDVPNGR
jgi:uncharacterized protein YbaA (DUF1428 family)